jgi:hypothetical protein
LAGKSTDIHAAWTDFDAYISRLHTAGFALDIGKRALARAISTRQGSQGFANELFAEATAYYASRDLPSFVGSAGRVETPSQGIQLKTHLKAVTRSLVAGSTGLKTDPDGWAEYVGTIISRLRSRG